MATTILFSGSSVTANNLGNQGPELTDPPYIEYSNLMSDLPDDICLRISNKTEYIPSTIPGGGNLFNGLSGEFGQINVKSATEVDLEFLFINKTSEEPFIVPTFAFSWFDFDTGFSGFRAEKLIVDMTYHQFFVTDTTTLLITDEGAGRIGFTATVPGSLNDNPMVPMDLTPEQEDKAVSFIYKDLSSFCVTLMIAGPENENGRNLVFGGGSSLIEIPSPPPMAIMKSDPHFQGLDGEHFDFDGTPGRVYALVCHERDGIALVARFTRAYTTGIAFEHKGNKLTPYKTRGTWVSSLALHLRADSVEEAMTATLYVAASSSAFPDGDAGLDFGSLQLSVSSVEAAALMEVAALNRDTGSMVQFRSAAIDGTVHIIPPPDCWEVDPTDTDTRNRLSHLNVAIDRLSTSDVDELEGIIGQTAVGVHPSDVEGEGIYEAQGLVDPSILQYLP